MKSNSSLDCECAYCCGLVLVWVLCQRNFCVEWTRKAWIWNGRAPSSFDVLSVGEVKEVTEGGWFWLVS